MRPNALSLAERSDTVMTGQYRRYTAMLLSVGLLMGQGAASALECSSPAKAMARVELMFGGALPDGHPVSDEQWTQFVDQEVTPRVPDGLSVFAGNGQWRRPDGVIGREPSRMLLIWYAPTTQKNTDIEAIRAAYKTRFKQLSVMRVDGTDCVSF